jgi:hypothetical protein
MKRKTFIVLFDVGHTFDARPLAESIEGENFEVDNQSNCETVSSLRIREQIIKRLELDEEDHEHVSVYPITDFMDEFNNEDIDADSYFMGYVTGSIIDIKGYDVFSDGKCKDTFLGGVGGFIYVGKNGTIDTSFQCDIEEYSDDEDSMYGLESVAIAKGLTFEYPILDVSQGDSIMMAHELVEPMRSKFIFEWMERQHGEVVTGIIVDDQWGTYDADKITLAYNHFNPKPVVREDSIELFKLVEMHNISYNGVYYEVHVDATDERSIFDVFAESGEVTDEIRTHLDEVVSKIDNI